MTTETDKSDIFILPDFVEGAELCFFLSNTGSSSTERTALTCTIVKTFRPFTLSPVLLVSLVLLSTSPADKAFLPITAILKLYDRRHLTNIRDDFDDAAPWSPHKECEYQQYLNDVSTGAVACGDFASSTFLWDKEVSGGEFEAYLQYQAQKIFSAERTAYERVHTLQGRKIPRLYGVVEYEITIPNARDDGSAITESVPGLLLEYVSGLTLRQLIATWKARNPPAAERGPGVVVRGGGQSRRPCLRLRPTQRGRAYRQLPLTREPFVNSSSAIVEDAVVLVDLGQSRLRRGDESEDDWVKAKWSQDETSAVGFVVLGLVREFVGEDIWLYERSLRYYHPLAE